MANPEQIEQELREFLQNEDSIHKGDRIHALMAIVNKHFALDKIDHIASKFDLDCCISEAKRVWPLTKMPMNISKKEVSSHDVVHVLILEAFVEFLNKNKLLKKVVKFDHTDGR